MSAHGVGKTLPIRKWLALALIVTFVVPVVVTGIVAFNAFDQPWVDTNAAARQLRRDADRWEDPAWQAAMRAELAEDGIDVVLMDGDRELFRSNPDPLATTDGDSHQRVVRTVMVPGSERVAYLYTDDGGWPGQRRRNALVPLTGLTVLSLTLGGIAWFLGRTVVRPLKATSQAARQVAAGDLDIALPRSGVREVAEVNAAFEAMSAGLRASLEEQARLEQERRLFIGAVVHDLRTPLFSLRGYLEGLEHGVADTPEKRARYVAVAQEKADALERLVSDLFDFTRLEYLDQAPNRETLDLHALLQRLVDSLRPQAEAKGVRLTVADAPEPCVVEADSHLLSRAIENLLDNALRFTPSGGMVTVACRNEPEGMTFTISDTGPGIPPHDLPNLFTPLFRGESSRNRRTGGAGLGLTIARRILRAHGGDLTAGNRLTGGAVFTGTLPGTSKQLPDDERVKTGDDVVMV